MADWQVGDLALCVVGPKKKPERTRKGAIYTVIKVGQTATGNLGLLLEGVYVSPLDISFGFKRASRFRKVTPDAEDAFDREVIAHMAGQEVDA